MQQIISFLSFGLFFGSVIWFCDYILNLHMYKKYPSNLKQFFHVSKRLRNDNFVKFSDLFKNESRLDKSSIIYTKLNEEDIYKSETSIIVDDKNILSLQILFNNSNEDGKAFRFSTRYDAKFHAAPLKPKVTYIPNLILESDLATLTLSGVRIGELVIKGNIDSSFSTITNCWIQTIKFDNIDNTNAPNLDIRHSNIGSFDLQNGKVANLSFNNCMINVFKTPLKYDNSPIEGDIRFTNTSLTDIDENFPPINQNNIHYLRNLRNILDDASNKKASRYVLGYEKRIQRNELRGTSKWIDYLYDSVSFYNNSPERILGFIGFILLIMYSFLLVGDINIYVDKQLIDITTDWASYLKNSFLFLLQSIISPVATVKGSAYFTLESVSLRFVYSILSIIIWLLMTLYIFGLKRKYQD